MCGEIFIKEVLVFSDSEIEAYAKAYRVIGEANLFAKFVQVFDFNPPKI